MTSAISGRYGNTVARDYTSGGEQAGRLVGETLTLAGRTYTVGYAYDAADRTTTLTYPDTTTATRSYTARNQLNTLGYAGATVASRIYTDGMRLQTTSYANGLSEGRDYFTDGLVQDIATAGVASFTYAYDADKRKTSESLTSAVSEPQSFGYDLEDRLTTWSRSTTAAQDQAWTLSLVGDWTQTNSTTPTPFTENRAHDAVHDDRRR